MDEKVPVTAGVHHVGLTVSDLEASAGFFTGILGWQEVRQDPAYPAVFVSDGTVLITLWGAKVGTPTGFNKDTNIGLHHLALKVESENALKTVHEKLQASGITIEFPPEPLRDGPAQHMMCYDPSGIRIEFIYLP